MRMIKWLGAQICSDEFDRQMERFDRARDEERLAQMRRLQAYQDALSATRQGLIDVRDLLAEDQTMHGVLQ